MRDRNKPDHRRTLIADEAAKIMQEQSVRDFRAAKSKATERLGLTSNVPLPSNGEIEAALAERNRIFLGDSHTKHLREARRAALEIMHWLGEYHPCLVGPVLSGNVADHSMIDLHLFSDSVEDVGYSLDGMGIRHRSVQRRMRVRHDRLEPFPGYRFFASDYEVHGVVFPERRRAHAPLSPVDGRPMRRASFREVEELISDR